MARLSISEGARRVGMSRQTLHKHITAGKLSVIREGDSVEVDEAELFRVYGNAFTPVDVKATVADLHHVTPDFTAEIDSLRQELTAARQREIWLQQHVDRLASSLEQAQKLLAAPAAESPAVEKGFWTKRRSLWPFGK